MARNWLVAFRPASFRGVPFKVDVEEAAGARRLSVSPIAYAEASVIEDMGRSPRQFRITAYCAGDAADSEAKALIAVLDRKGGGQLVLPMLPGLRARVTDWALSRRRDYAGYVGIDIGFIEEGLSAVPFGALAGAGAVGAMLAAGAAVLGAALAARTAGLTPPAMGIEAAASVRASGRFLAAVPLALAGTAKPREVATAEDAVAAASDPADAAGLGASAEALARGWRALALFANAGATKLALEDALAEAGGELTTLADTAQSVAGIGALSAVVLRIDYPARQDATVARERLRQMAAPVIEIAGGLGDAVLALAADATGEAALQLSRIAATRAPLVRVETGLSLSSIRAAYDLYGDANRAGELVARNRVATPVFMPTSFEAVSV